MNKTLAKFFYEQCAGTTCGHMASIPNNSVLFSLCAAQTGKQDSGYAATEAQFAEMLRAIADKLDQLNSPTGQ